jgi:hypothetical protein
VASGRMWVRSMTCGVIPWVGSGVIAEIGSLLHRTVGVPS